MSKFYSKLAYGFVASTAFLCSSGAFAQVCNATAVGNYTEAVNEEGDSWYTLDIEDIFSGDITYGIDTNGGFGYVNGTGAQIPNRFTEMGTHGVGETLRVNGFTGNYNSFDPFDPLLDFNKRDLDYIHIKLTTPCYITIELSMNDKNGDPILAANGTASAFQFFRWADPIGDPYGDKAGDNSAGNDFYYGEQGRACPQLVEYTFPDGETEARFAVPAGDIIFTVYVPFNATGYRTLEGPMAWGLNIDITAHDFTTCGVAANNCITASAQGGCSDGQCCDTVCVSFPECCATAWDASCLQNGVELCGNFIYSCANPSSVVSNDCVGGAELISTFPSTVNFDNTTATQDGPNDVTRLCTSQMKHDLWYVVGPAPVYGDIIVSMCGLNNPIATDTDGDGEIDDFPADAVINVFDMGLNPTVPNPQDLTSIYIGCVDDSCLDGGAVDDTGAPVVDIGSSAAFRQPVEAGHYLLIAVGQYEAVTDDGTTTSPEGFAASMTIDFSPVFVHNGLQSTVVNKETGANTSLGLLSGYVDESRPFRWSFVPFEMPQAGTINNLNFPAFIDADITPNVLQYKIIARNTSGGGAYGEFLQPFGTGGLFDANQVIVEGSEAFNSDDFYDIGDAIGQRYYVDISNPFVLQPGSYYLTLYGAEADGANTYLAWCVAGLNGMNQVTTAPLTIDAADTAGAGDGTWPAGTPFTWRGIGAGPNIKWYNLSDEYSPGLAPVGASFNPVFDLAGTFDTAPPCPTDLNDDAFTDSSDLGSLLGSFGVCDLGARGDFNDDLFIDSSDLGTMLGNFGPCPTE